MECRLFVFVLCLTVSVSVQSLTIVHPSTPLTYTQEQQEQQRLGEQTWPNSARESCKKLCNDCGCRSYYCGDECICECNTADDSNVNCIQTMRERAQQQQLPFEVLIQGPAGRRFVREATDIDPEQMATYRQTERTGRSVYSIYKPVQFGKGGLKAVASDDGHHPLRLGAIGGLTGERLNALRGRLAVLGSPKSETAAASGHDPTVGAPAPADPAPTEPTVAAPAPAPEAAPAAAPVDPVVASPNPAETAAAPAPAAAEPAPASDGPIVGSTNEKVGSPLLKHLKLHPLPGLHWPKDLFKKLGHGLVGNPLIVQPEHTL